MCVGVCDQLIHMPIHQKISYTCLSHSFIHTPPPSVGSISSSVLLSLEALCLFSLLPSLPIFISFIFFSFFINQLMPGRALFLFMFLMGFSFNSDPLVMSNDHYKNLLPGHNFEVPPHLIAIATAFSFLNCINFCTKFWLKMEMSFTCTNINSSFLD